VRLEARRVFRAGDKAATSGLTTETDAGASLRCPLDRVRVMGGEKMNGWMGVELTRSDLSSPLLPATEKHHHI